MSVVLNEVSKIFGKQKAVDGISFSVGKGEILGFLGPNGAGKSTTMKMVTGFLETDGGSIEVMGEKVQNGDVNTKKHIGYLSEANPLYYDMYVREYLQFIAQIHKIPKPKSRIEDLLSTTGLDKEANKLIGNLSKGFKQRVGLVQALLHDPAVLILDEPTSGLDMNQLVDIRALIKSLKEDKTIIFSTHIMQEVQALCTRVIIINEGKLIIDGPIEQLQKLSSSSQSLHLEVSNLSDKARIFEQIPHVTLERKDGNMLVLKYPSDMELRPTIFKACVDNGLIILDMHLLERDVELIFQQLTKAGSHA